MHSQLMQDFLALKPATRKRVQEELGITFHQGLDESDKNFSVRVLTAVENEGKIRLLEQLLTD